MNQDEARRIIADYLTLEGEVPPERLQEACDVAGADDAYAGFLAEELGFHGEWVSECERFREQVAEFCSLTAAQQRDEMPEAVAHLGVCHSCRDLRWIVQPLWQPVVAGARRLVESLKVAVAPLGELLEQGIGPPALSQPVVAEVMGEEGERLRAAQREWLLEDEEAGVALHMVLRGGSEGSVEVDCQLRTQRPDEETAAQVRLEVVSEPRGEPYVAGGLDLVRSFVLAPGRWTIRVRISREGEPREWIVPVEILPQGDDGP